MEDGTPFGRYRLLNLLGRGGMGEVWRAFDTVTEREVALKLLPAQFANDATYQERFRREARSAAGLDEPHVVPIYDFGEIDGRLFVTMRLIKGHDLHTILGQGRMEVARVVEIIDQVASALNAAHQVGLIHRDVKPSNILVGNDDFAYLIDFGIARAAGQSGLTDTSSVIGTWAYMAPERLATGEADARSDVYALACVLYESLTGSQPFPGVSLEQQIGGHIALPPPRPSDRHADLPAGLDAVIAKGMAKDPDERYATTRELARAAKGVVTAPMTRVAPVFHTTPAPFANPYPTPTPTPSTFLTPNSIFNPIPTPVPDPTHDRGPQPAYIANRPMVTPGDPSPIDATQFRASIDPAQYRSAPHGPNTLSSKPSSKGRIIALMSIGAMVAIVAVVVAIVLPNLGSKDAAGPAATTTPAALPNTGPFTGTFTVEFGAPLDSPGAPVGGVAYTQTWLLRSACGANGCVATASTGQKYPVKELVFDKVGERWLAVANSRETCRNRNDDEAWNVVSLQPQPDGTMSGETTQSTVQACFTKRSVTVRRTGDADIALLPNPATIAARVVSPAEALRGRYDSELTRADGASAKSKLGVRTDCLRAGDRCMSFFVNPLDGRVQVFVFANGAWTRNDEFDTDCSGAPSHLKYTATLPLPVPPQNPIMLLAGHGYVEVTGSTCKSQDYDQKFTRTGD